MEVSKKIFITGVGRSGTSLLQSMLNAHSQIHFPPETHFFKRYIVPSLLKKNKAPLYEEMKSDRYLQRLSQALRLKIIQQNSYTTNDLKQSLVDIMKGELNTTVIGDKDTEYVRYLPHLKKVFPDSCLIHIKRDPRDVVASRKKAEWSKGRNTAFHAAEYAYYIEIIEKKAPVLFNNKYISLRYEDLLQNPEQELKNILKLLELPYDQKVLEFHKQSSTLVSQDEAGWKQNLSKPLMIKNKGKWKETLSEKEAALVQHGIESFMEANGYKTDAVSAPFFKLIEKQLIMWMFRAKTYKEQIR
jgi:hypothetical protein